MKAVLIPLSVPSCPFLTMDEQFQTLEHAQQTAVGLAIQFGPQLLVALLILAAGFYVGSWIGKLAGAMLARLGLSPSLRRLLVRTVRAMVMGLFIIMALQNLGVKLLPLLAWLGVAGAGIALAMPGVLRNLAAGLTIIFTRPFQVGEILHNFGSLRQRNGRVGVAYDTDIKLALAAIRELPAAHPVILQAPEPMIQVWALADSGVEIAIRPWTTVEHDYDTSSAITQAVPETFRARGIHIPFPQREVRLLGQS